LQHTVFTTISLNRADQLDFRHVVHCGGFGCPDCVADVSVAQWQSALRQAVVRAQTVTSAAMRPMGEGHPDCTADVLVAWTAQVFRSRAGKPHCTAVLLGASLQKFADLASAAARPLRQGRSDCTAEVSVPQHRAALQSSSALLLLVRAHRREHRGPIHCSFPGGPPPQY
jgi:hypothetical protein